MQTSESAFETVCSTQKKLNENYNILKK